MPDSSEVIQYEFDPTGTQRLTTVRQRSLQSIYRTATPEFILQLPFK